MDFLNVTTVVLIRKMETHREMRLRIEKRATEVTEWDCNKELGGMLFILHWFGYMGDIIHLLFKNYYSLV